MPAAETTWTTISKAFPVRPVTEKRASPCRRGFPAVPQGEWHRREGTDSGLAASKPGELLKSSRLPSYGGRKLGAPVRISKPEDKASISSRRRSSGFHSPNIYPVPSNSPGSVQSVVSHSGSLASLSHPGSVSVLRTEVMKARWEDRGRETKGLASS